MVGPDTAVGEVARMMVARGIHHVVVSEDEHIRGVVFVARLRQEIHSGGVITGQIIDRNVERTIYSKREAGFRTYYMGTYTTYSRLHGKT